MVRRQNWDWLELLAAARARREARNIFDLAQGQFLGGDSRGWQEWQRKMIERING